MDEYKVKVKSEVEWEITVDAESPEDAMMKAEEMSLVDGNVTGCINEAWDAHPV